MGYAEDEHEYKDKQLNIRFLALAQSLDIEKMCQHVSAKNKPDASDDAPIGKEVL